MRRCVYSEAAEPAGAARRSAGSALRMHAADRVVAGPRAGGDGAAVHN